MRHLDANATLLLNRLRRTHPRMLVLDALTAIGAPCTPGDIREYLITKQTPCPQPTLYRVLHQLCNERIVHAIPLTDRFALCAFPRSGGHHGYFLCKKCAAVQ